MSKSKYNRFKNTWLRREILKLVTSATTPREAADSNSVARQIFMEDKERGHALFERICKANKVDLAIYLTDPCEETRWLAKWKLAELTRDVKERKMKTDWKEVYNEVHNEVWDEVESEVGREVRDEVRREVWKEVRKEVWKEVESEVRNEVWKEVEKELGEKDED